jgi:hypothetical protein
MTHDPDESKRCPDCGGDRILILMHETFPL